MNLLEHTLCYLKSLFNDILYLHVVLPVTWSIGRRVKPDQFEIQLAQQFRTEDGSCGVNHYLRRSDRG